MKQKTEEQAEFNKRVLIILSIGFVLIVIFQAFLYLNQSDNQALQATIEAQQTIVAGLLPTLTYTPSRTPTATISPSPTMTFTPSPTPSYPYRLYEPDYPSDIYFVDWHPSENIIAFGYDHSFDIIIYDAIERREIRRQQGLTDSVRNVRWSPDARYLAAGDTNGRILVWDTSTWEPVTSLALSDYGQRLIWSYNGRFIVASSPQQVRIWETNNWSMVEDADIGSIIYTTIAIAPDASRVAYNEYDKLMAASIVRNGEMSPPHSIAELPEERHYFILASWSDDGRWILGGTNDGEIFVFDAETEERQHILAEHFGDIVDLRWSRDGRYLASAGVDETVHVWDTTSWNLLMTLNVSGTGDIDSIAWSPDNCFIAVDIDDIEIWTLPELCEQEF